ncbi:MAG TPA: DUF2163 domain-containing protein [Rhizomicrobium sp.]|nr:DUF2163 domain-containing protein [Rhizomicrobium sp.]
MKTLPSGLQDHLDSGTTTLCWCWKLAPVGAGARGFTDHDADVTFDGTTYLASSGFTASEIDSTLGLAVDNLSVAGALSGDALAEADLAAGVYDAATVEIWRVNWASPGQRVLMRTGTLGEVQRGHAGFTAELRGLAAALNQAQGRVFGFSCDADLGDARCTVDLSAPAFHGAGTVVTAFDARRFAVSGLDAFATGWFAGGKLAWTGGANAGRAMDIKRHAVSGTNVTIELWQPMSEAVAPADAFAATAGCDKQFATCKSRFANAANFRGFPYMIGNDAAISYPTQRAPLDGGSRYGNG